MMEEVINQIDLNIDKSNWKLVKFGDVAFEPKEVCKDIIEENVEHVVGLEHIDSGDIHLRKSATVEDATTFTKKFRKGDVLFGRRRAYLKKAAQAEFDGICSGDITVFRSKKDLSPDLLPFIVHDEKFFDYAIKHSAGGLSPRVKFKDLANYEFLLPPKSEQARLAELLWAMDEVIEREGFLLKNLAKLKETIVMTFFTVKACLNKWPHRKIAELASNGKYSCIGGPFGSDLTSKHYVNYEGVPVIRGINLSGGSNSFNEDQFVYVSEKKALSLHRNLAFPGDLVITQRGTMGQVGLISKSSKHEKFVISQSQMKLTVDEEKILPQFLYYFFNSKLGQEKIKGATIATGVPHINLGIFKEFEIPTPPLDDQIQLIDEILNIQNSIKNLSVLLSSSCALQKSLINQIF